MKILRYFAVITALICVFTLAVFADDWYIGDWDDFEDATTTPVETTTEEQTTEPVTSETEEQTTEPETSETEDQTTEPDASESGEVTTEPDTSESEEVTTEPDGSVTEDQTTEPAASGTDAPATTSPAESETSGDQEKPWMLPIPVIFITIGVVGIGGIVLLVILLRMYFRAQQEDEKK